MELLDWSADPDHNRAVLTYVGEPEAVLAATQALCREAFAVIDMRTHEGAHPRMGAVDVIPFVPLRGVTTEEAVALAQQAGRVDRRSRACPSTTTRRRPPVRSGSRCPTCAGGNTRVWRPRLATPEGAPDAGPAVFNERSGASIVGVRFPLIAFNVNLATSDLSIARRIAEAVRFSSGGYRYVRAMGVALEDKGQVQVSTDILQYEKTPIHRVLETVRSEAARYGVAVVGCELIGLAPLDAFAEAIRHYMQIHDFSSDQIIENRLLEV